MAQTRTHGAGAGSGAGNEPESRAADIVNREAEKEAQARFAEPSEVVAEEVFPGQQSIPVRPRAEGRRRKNIASACASFVARRPLLSIGAFVVAGIVLAAMRRR